MHHYNYVVAPNHITVEPIYSSHPWTKIFGLTREVAGINCEPLHSSHVEL